MGHFKGLVILAIIAFSLVAAGCKGNLPAADGTSVYNYINDTSRYTEWKMWPGKQALYPGTEPHGMLLTTYVTDGAFSAIDGKKGSIPDGSIIVKENYMPDETLAAVTVMYKVKGFDPDHNDWFWLKYAPDGTIEVSGRVQDCYSCHGAQQDNDYIFTSSLK